MSCFIFKANIFFPCYHIGLQDTFASQAGFLLSLACFIFYSHGCSQYFLFHIDPYIGSVCFVFALAAHIVSPYSTIVSSRSSLIPNVSHCSCWRVKLSFSRGCICCCCYCYCCCSCCCYCFCSDCCGCGTYNNNNFLPGILYCCKKLLQSTFVKYFNGFL